jgi:hypothetical protein
LSFTDASSHSLIGDRRFDLSRARTAKTIEFEPTQLRLNVDEKGSLRLFKERLLNESLVESRKRRYM